MIRLLIAIGLALATTQASAQIAVPKSYVDGEVIHADELNTNLKAIADVVPPRDCATDQNIKWDDTNGIWVCADDPFAGLNCVVGDQLRMGSGGWECRAEPITASLIKSSWDYRGGVLSPVNLYFDSVNNVDPDTICTASFCDIEVIGVVDHTSCVVQVTGDAVQIFGSVLISTTPSDINISPINTWTEGLPVYINISCTP